MAKWYEDGPIKPPPKRTKRKKSYYRPVAKRKEVEVKLTEREQKFLTYRFIDNLPHLEAAKKAGYGDGYARTALYKNIWTGKTWQAKMDKFLEGFPAARRRVAIARLPKHMEIEEKFLDECRQNPKMYAKFGKFISDRDYSLSGLASDDTPTPPSVNIKEVQNLMIQMVAQSPGRLGKIPAQIEYDDADIEIEEETDG